MSETQTETSVETAPTGRHRSPRGSAATRWRRPARVAAATIFVACLALGFGLQPMNRAPEGGLSYELTSGGCSTATTQERSLADPSPSSWFTNIRRCEAAERPASLWNHFTSEIEAASDRFHGFLHHVLRKLRFFFHWHHGHGGGGNNGQNGNNGDNGQNGNNGNQSLAFVVS